MHNYSPNFCPDVVNLLTIVRFLVVPAAVVGLVLVTVGYLYKMPSEYLQSQFFWFGFIFYFLDSWFLLMNLKSKPTSRVGALIFLGSGFFGIALSDNYPDALPFVSGFVGLFVGIALRASIGISTRARWRYCPQCGESTWFVKKEGNWVCRKPEHQNNSPTVPKSDNSQGIQNLNA